MLVDLCITLPCLWSNVLHSFIGCTIDIHHQDTCTSKCQYNWHSGFPLVSLKVNKKITVLFISCGDLLTVQLGNIIIR